MATGNFEIVALRHGYSGHSMVAKSLTAHAPWRAGGIVSVGVEHAINPYCYRCPLKLTYPECEVACADDVEEVIRTSTAGRIAAFLAEPIQGVGGFITPPLEYFKKVYETVKKAGGLFIADEVQTGFGRTGKKWFGIEHFGVEPDILTAAKGMANGAPVGATIAKAEVADKFQGMTLSTFGGNPVTATAARATIDVIEEENLLENTHTVGGYLREKLEALKEKFPVIGDVRGMGLMQALELVKDPETKEPAPEQAGQLMEHCRTNGLLIGKGGLNGNVIRIAPPMNIGQSDVDEAAEKLEKSLAQVIL
jgi:4-aminobutyrate aminotransferase